MLAEAIEAALFAQDFERAGRLIEHLNEHAYSNEYHTMRRWLEQIPQNLLAAHPVLCFLLAQARIFTEKQPDGVWRIEPAEDMLQLAEKGWRAQGDMLQVGMHLLRRAGRRRDAIQAPKMDHAAQRRQLFPQAGPLTTAPDACARSWACPGSELRRHRHCLAIPVRRWHGSNQQFLAK